MFYFDSVKIFQSLLKAVIIIVIFAVFFLILPHEHWGGLDEENDQGILDMLLNRLYFTSTTFSTAGYGDIYPKSRIAKLLVMILQLLIAIVVLDHVKITLNTGSRIPISK